jgi:hypothetical protein
MQGGLFLIGSGVHSSSSEIELVDISVRGLRGPSRLVVELSWSHVFFFS